jgi:hypothetical protein
LRRDSPRRHQGVISLLSLPLADYRVAVDRAFSVADAAVDSGASCSRCGTAACAREHASYVRQWIVDRASVAERVPICRIVFCDGRTASLMPAVLWRGRGTISFVVDAVTLVWAIGLEAAWERLRSAGPWCPSRSTLGRWRQRVRAVLAVSAALLARRVELPELAAGDILLSLRRATGRGALDRLPAPAPRRPARRIAGRLAPAPPPETGGPRRPRGAWSRAAPRGPPREAREEETTDD